MRHAAGDMSDFKIETTPSAGFCFGVRRAVDRVYELTEGNKKIYSRRAMGNRIGYGL